MFKATIEGASANNMSLPRDTETMVQQVDVWVGSDHVQHTTHYGQLFRTVMDYMVPTWKQYNRGYLCNSLYIPDGLNDAVWFNIKDRMQAMNLWLGFLGCNAVLDTRNTCVRIELTLAPNTVLVADSASATFKMDNVCLLLHELGDDQASKVTANVRVDNFMCSLQHNVSYSQEVQLNVPTRQLDWVIGTFLPSDYAARAISTSTDYNGSSYYFVHGTGEKDVPSPFSWNFIVDSKDAIGYYPDVDEAQEYVRTIWPYGCGPVNGMLCTDGVMQTVSREQMQKYMWATGVNLQRKSKPNENGFNVMFRTQAPGSTLASNFSLLMAKFTSTLTYDAASGRYSFVL